MFGARHNFVDLGFDHHIESICRTRGQSATSLAEIYAEHPQLERLFRTLFAVRIIGHAEAGGPPVHYLPALPPETFREWWEARDRRA